MTILNPAVKNHPKYSNFNKNKCDYLNCQLLAHMLVIFVFILTLIGCVIFDRWKIQSSFSCFNCEKLFVQKLVKEIKNYSQTQKLFMIEIFQFLSLSVERINLLQTLNALLLCFPSDQRWRLINVIFTAPLLNFYLN